MAIERPPFVFTFHTDQGEGKMTYEDYLKNDYLRKLVNDEDMARLFLGRTIILYSKDFLACNDVALETFAALEQLWRSNPLQFYAPATHEMQDLINDWMHDVFFMVAPNRVGKTTAQTVKLLLGAIPMERDWPIFRDHGIDYVPFREPMDLAAATYKEKNLRDTVWPKMLRYWIPDSQLGVYGKTYRGAGAKSAPAWGHGDITINLKCGSHVSQFTYEQDQDVFESGVFKRWLWDEQGKEHLFDGADERGRNVKAIHLFSLTPHKVEGRADTGAGSFIHKMCKGEEKKGHNPITYTSGIQELPDWIYPESEKHKAFEKWEHEPRRLGNNRRLREGRARLYGEWHSTAGLVITSWQPEYSWIDPLWKQTPPLGWTLYRAIDHGKVNPTACLSLAVDKDLNVVIYREMYTKGDNVFQNVRRLVEAAGNSLKPMGNTASDRRGVIIERFEEVYEKENYAKQVLDSRSFAGMDDGTGKPLGWLYKMAGIRVSPASGARMEQWIPMLEEYLNVDPHRKHLVTGKMGAPRLYVFNTCVNFKREIEGWAMKDSGLGQAESEKPSEKDNHCMTAVGYGLQIPLRFLGDIFTTTKPRAKKWYEEVNTRNDIQYNGYRRIG